VLTLPNPDLFVFMDVRKEAVLSSQIPAPRTATRRGSGIAAPHGCGVGHGLHLQREPRGEEGVRLAHRGLGAIAEVGQPVDADVAAAAARRHHLSVRLEAGRCCPDHFPRPYHRPAYVVV
jgi:hypothetical protein